jgi:pilus assembly protein CpaB
MDLQHKLAFTASLILGIVATFLLAQILERRAEGAVTPVVVAKAAMPKGAVLQADQLHVVDWPARSVPAEVLTSLDGLAGRMLRENLLAGEPLLDSKLWPSGSKGNLLDAIPIGQRAMTVRIQDLSGLSPDDLTGASVDVLLSARDAQGQPFSKLVLEGAQVLAVPSNTRSGSREGLVTIQAVTLLLSPTDAQRLDLARSLGVLSLSLRRHGDAFEAGLPALPKAQLLGAPTAAVANTAPTRPSGRQATPLAGQMPVTVTAPPPAHPTIEIIRGAQRQAAP